MNYTKRIVALVLACLIMISFIPPVTVSAASSDAVTFLNNNGVLQGFGNGDLGLDKVVTREQFVTYLYRVAGEPSVKGTSQFTDVSAGSYYYNAVLWAQQKGITFGVSKTKFGVGSSLTYEQVVTFLYRFGNLIFTATSANMTKGTVPKGYTKYNSSGACPEMLTALAWANNKGLLKGTADKIKVGTNACTRGDAVQLIYNFYKAFRKTYALSACTKDAYDGYNNPNPGLMAGIFNGYLTQGETLIRGSSSSINSKTQLEAAFQKAFAKATCIDVCYFYINSHGDANKGLTDKKGNSWLSTSDLKELVDKYPAKFVIMLEACYSGQFVQYFKNTKCKADLICASSSTQPSGAANMVPNGRTQNAYGIATACWREALFGTNPGADSRGRINITYYSSKLGKLTQFAMLGQGNGDGFVSLSELTAAVKLAVNTVAKSAGTSAQTVCYYSPASQPAYCAFGNLD